MSITYCCEIFRNHLNLGSARGLNIVFVQSKKRLIGNAFFLQFRAVSEEQDSIRFDSGDVVLLREFKQAIQFCPWCGVKLATYYRPQFGELPRVDDACA